MKTALITGVVGQDGAYLARHLGDAGYRVIGTMPGIEPPPGFIGAYLKGLDVRVVDLQDQAAMRELLDTERPDEIYNLASISSVAASWQAPVPVAQVNGVAFLGLLEEIRTLRAATGYEPRVLQASSAEIFGTPVSLPQHEAHPIRPTNPYASAKAFAHFTAGNYRDAFGIFVSTVILFNHESPLRPGSFVTRKITQAVARIAAGDQDVLELGNMSVRRDWGSARDYVRCMRLALSADVPSDYCVASGESHEIGDFVGLAFAAVGISDPARHVRVNQSFIRPTDIPETRGDPRRAEQELGWRRTMAFEDVVSEMVHADVQRLSSGVEHRSSYLDASSTT